MVESCGNVRCPQLTVDVAKPRFNRFPGALQARGDVPDLKKKHGTRPLLPIAYVEGGLAMAFQTIRRMVRRLRRGPAVAAPSGPGPAPAKESVGCAMLRPESPQRDGVFVARSAAGSARGPVLPPELPELEELATRDLWFYEHFIKVPRIVAEHLGRVIPLEQAVILDFGCGEGLMAKGLARYTDAVHGVDVMFDFGKLEERFARMFGPNNQFPRVDLQVVVAGKPLPYEDGAFDGIFTWSVFEHVADVPFALGELFRVLRPGGALLLQIAPLYYSPHGGHLRNMLDEPWIHLKLSRDELFDRIRRAARDQVPEAARDAYFHEKSSQEFAEYMISGVHSLNGITVRELTEHVRAAGFRILNQLTMQDDRYEVPLELREKYSNDDLLTEQVVMLMTR
jgi:SAM-dependent methyltransferase